MSIPVLEGQNLYLKAQLINGETGKFVRAIVQDDSGAAIVGSPITLTEGGGGFYFDNTTLQMPGKPFVTAILEAFNDSGFTQSAGFGIFEETYNLKTTAGLIQGAGQVIIGKVLQSQKLSAALKQESIEGSLESNTIVGTVKDNQIVGDISSQTIEGDVE